MTTEKLKTETMSALKNKKIVLGVVALALGLAVTFLFSFVPYTLKPERLRSMEFLTDIAITLSLVTLAMISTMVIAQASNAQNPKSNLAKNTARFLATKQEVEVSGVRRFKKWISEVQAKNDLDAYKRRLLAKIGIEDASVAALSEDQIRTLTVPQNIDGEFYAALRQEQINELIRMKRKGFQLPSVPPEYYLTTKRLLDPRTRTERAAAEGKKKTLTMLVDIGARLVMTAASAVILMMFVMEAAGGDVLSAVAKTVSRIWSFLTSTFFGYTLGCKMNDIDAEYVLMRVETHLEYLEDKTYTVKSEKEEAKDQFIERMREEQRLIPMASEKPD